MDWIDLHCDTLSELYNREKHRGTLKNNNLCVDLERLEQAGAKVQFFACYVNKKDYMTLADQQRTDCWDKAYDAVFRMIRMARSAENEEFTIVKTAEDIKDIESSGRNRVGGVLTVEEGGVLNGRPERLRSLYECGIRLVTLTWNYRNCLGSPNSRERNTMEQGLTRFGIETLEQMNDLGILIDVSHLSDGGFWDCMKHSRYPVVASHSNARALCPHPRNLSDKMLRALGEQGGVVGINFYSAFLCENRKADTEDIVRHVRWVMDQAGEDAAAFGTDFDGCEQNSLPESIRGVQDMEKIWVGMARAGISERQIEKIACKNVQRVLREVWK